MGIIHELQNEATSNENISNLIRKAYMVAKKLDLREFEEWLYNELNGYKEYNSIPSYRKVICDLIAWNPYHGWVPVIIDNTELNDIITHRKINDSISYLAKVRNENDTAQLPIPNDIRNFISKMCDFDTKYTISFSTSYIDGIIEIVQNSILKWALNLEKEGIIGDNMTFTDKEKEIAKNTSNITNYITGNVGNLMLQQNSDNSTQIQNNLENLNENQIKELDNLLKIIKDNIQNINELNSSDIAVINEKIQNIEQSKKSNSLAKKGLKEGLGTIRNLLEGATGSIIASGIIYKLGMFSSSL